MRRHSVDFDDLEEDEFLAGPDRYADWQAGQVRRLYSVNDAHERLISEILDEHPADRAEERRARPSSCAPGYAYADHPDGVILRCPKGRIAGVYLGLHLALHPPHRGKGLGSELVVERAIRSQGLPGWDLDPPAYTRAGLRAHQSAWRQITDPVERNRIEIQIFSGVDALLSTTCGARLAHA